MHNRREDFTVYSPVRGKFVGYKLPRHLALLFQCLAEETFSGSSVSPFSNQNINHIAILIHGTPEIVTFTSNCDE